MLDNLDDILALLQEPAKEASDRFTGIVPGKVTDHLFCPKCSEIARMRFSVHESGSLGFQLMAQKHCPEYLTPGEFRPKGLGHPSPDSEPTMLIYECQLCRSRTVAIIHWSAAGPAVSVFPECQSSFSGGSVPEEVSYHLDEAFAAHSINANTASVASFRAALENLLYQQGYTSGMLGEKIETLEKDQKSGNGPGWVKHIDVEMLKLIQRLGNKAIHIKRISRLVAFDAALARRLIVAFKYLVNLVYENGNQNAQLLAELKAINKKI